MPPWNLATNESIPPLNRCYWVVPGKLLAGAYPGHYEQTKHQNRVTGLFAIGMRTFINLVEEHEKSSEGNSFARYDDLLRTLALEEPTHVAHLRLSIPDLGVTSRDRMNSILDAIDLSMMAGRPVYVHCYGGIGRTGTVVCCWMLRHGLATTQNVFSVLTQLRQADVERAYRQAPETEVQRVFVSRWLDSN